MMYLLRVGNWLTLTLSEAEVIGSFSLGRIGDE